MRAALAGGAAVVVADAASVADEERVSEEEEEAETARVEDLGEVIVVNVVDADATPEAESEAEIDPAVEVKDTTVSVAILVLCTPVSEETVVVPKAEVEVVDNPPPPETITVLSTELAVVELVTNTTPVVPTPKLQLTIGLKLDGKAANAEESTESAFVVAGCSTQPEGPAVQAMRVVKVEVSVVRMGIMVAVVWLDVLIFEKR
ncbi:hypothetical protein AUEXF2481DRAFT_31540 [Aureobasidium subglaciale EXF-2481]|uniref:Uncharacterized protein n=1 Tax=Aureobasidium subglaciale (strain EXF-2481) TaxID=1043005 RepID=A0A074YAU9_AURSE|nr:uncharacterized protein AUEXF2481DRAFT_31540 [Aureobasidium subglaciale EXF-2481]KEQ93084.1 hypothetical protein AUEXF2481DRAFT_31540 [Aureobasidium subglaciale EXF-2481]